MSRTQSDYFDVPTSKLAVERASLIAEEIRLQALNHSNGSELAIHIIGEGSSFSIPELLG
ncbi:MAG: hypothetical protein ACPGSB_09145 [Opitutales bacterium]